MKLSVSQPLFRCGSWVVIHTHRCSADDLGLYIGVTFLRHRSP